MASQYHNEDRENGGKYVLAWVVLFLFLFALGFLAAGIVLT